MNVPTVEALEETALRLYFDAWQRTVELHDDFCNVYDVPIEDVSADHDFSEEWSDYVGDAQAELGAICATIQHCAEIRLKSIVCSVSPYLLLLNGSVPLKANAKDLDFTEQRTLDAVDLPRAVRTFTNFKLTDKYVDQYADMRKRRNQVAHLGSHQGGLTPGSLVKILGQQYMALWPDGRWLYRRTTYDGQSARRFFHDYRYSSAESTVMAELPDTVALFDDHTFKTVVGVGKGKLNGFCPRCTFSVARKSGVDAIATAHQKSKDVAQCMMCEADLTLCLAEEECSECPSKTFAEIKSGGAGVETVCFACGCG